MIKEQQQIAKILKNNLGVKESYQHASKRVTPGESIRNERRDVEVYALHELDLAIEHLNGLSVSNGSLK